MTKRKIVIIIAAVLLCLAAVAGISVYAIQKSGIAFKLGDGTENVWLDRYEEKNITVEDGDPKKLRWKSSDKKVVTVEDGRLSAQGVGTALVTVSSGFRKETIHVQVGDSGNLPLIDCEDFDAYQDAEIPIPARLKYNGEITDVVISYTADVDLTSIAEHKDGNIHGIELGETGAVIKAEYKGLQLERKVNITVKENSLVEFDSTEFEIYNAKDNGKFNSVVLAPTVIKNAKKLENPEVTYEIVDGADCVTLDGGTVTAAKDGTARVKASYQDKDIRVSTEITVNVLPNWVASSFISSSSLGDKWEPATGTVGGRKAEGSDMMEYHSSEKTPENSCWSHRVTSVDSAKTLSDQYRKGYRYFTYDVYYGSDARFYLGLADNSPEFISVGEFFGRDYVKLLADENGDGKLETTNCLKKNQWVTFVFDIKTLIEQKPTLKAGFFFTVDDDKTSSYVMNVRYYMDDTFMPQDGPVFTDKGDYKEVTEDELAVAMPVSEYELPQYAPYSKKVGGRTGVWRYQANEDSSWWNNLVVRSSLNKSYSAGMLRLSKLGRYLTFDIYIEEAKTIHLSLNHVGSNNVGTAASIRLGKTDLSKFSKWLKVYKGGKLQYTIEKAGWYTISLGYMDGCSLDAYRPTIYVSASNKGDVFYIDNVRYYKNADFLPTKYSGVQPPEGMETLHSDVSLERVTKGTFAGTTKLTSKNPADTWDNHSASVRFTDVTTNNGESSGSGVAEFFDSGYKYVKLDFYLAENTTGISWLSWSTHINYPNPDGKKEDTLLIGKLNLNTLLFDAQTKKYASELQANKWYTVFIPVEYDYTEVPNWSLIEFRVMGGSAEKPAVAYLKNLEYTKKTYSYQPSDILPQPKVSLTQVKRYGAWPMGYDALDITTACSGALKLIINNDKANPVEIKTTQSGNIYKVTYGLDKVLNRMLLGNNRLTVESSDGASTTITYENKGFLFVRDAKGELTYTTDNGETVLKYTENYKEGEENDWVGLGSSYISTKANHAGGFDIAGVKYMTMQVKLLKGDGIKLFYDLRGSEIEAGYGVHRIDKAVKVGERSGFLVSGDNADTLELNKWVTIKIPLFISSENPNDIYRNFSMQPQGFGAEMLIKDICYETDAYEGPFDVTVLNSKSVDYLHVMVPNQKKAELIVNGDTESTLELSLTETATGYEANYNIAKFASKLKIGTNLLTVRTSDGKSQTLTYENKFFMYAADEGGRLEYFVEDGVTVLKYTKGSDWQGLGCSYISTTTPWNGGFIAGGVKYITMDVKLVSGEGLNLFYDIANEDVAAGYGEHKISTTIKEGELSKYLVKDGYKTVLKKNEWVTVKVPLWALPNVERYRQFYIRPTGTGDKVMLVRNVDFLLDDYTEPTLNPEDTPEVSIVTGDSTDSLKIYANRDMDVKIIINDDEENTISLRLQEGDNLYGIQKLMPQMKIGSNKITVCNTEGQSMDIEYENQGFLYVRDPNGKLEKVTDDGETVLQYTDGGDWTGLGSRYISYNGATKGNYIEDGVKFVSMKVKLVSGTGIKLFYDVPNEEKNPDLGYKVDKTVKVGETSDYTSSVLKLNEWVTINIPVSVSDQYKHMGYRNFAFKPTGGGILYIKDISYSEKANLPLKATVEIGESTDCLKVVSDENAQTKLIINGDEDNAISLNMKESSLGYEASYDIKQVVNTLKIGDNVFTIKTEKGTSVDVSYNNTGFLYVQTQDGSTCGTLTVEEQDGEKVLKYVRDMSKWKALGSKYIGTSTEGLGDFVNDGIKYVRMTVKIPSANSDNKLLHWCDWTNGSQKFENDFVTGDSYWMSPAMAANEWITITYPLYNQWITEYKGWTLFYLKPTMGTMYIKDIQYLTEQQMSAQSEVAAKMSILENAFIKPINFSKDASAVYMMK